MDQNESPLPFVALDLVGQSHDEMMQTMEEVHGSREIGLVSVHKNDINLMSEKMDGSIPMILRVGRDNSEILKLIEEHKEELIKFGTRLSWDSDMNTVDVRTPSGKIERFTLTGSY